MLKRADRKGLSARRTRLRVYDEAVREALVVLVLVLHPLTGQAKVYSCRYRIPKRFGEPDTTPRAGGSPGERG
ncbi:MAG: hypothetical protein IPL40_00625 [Proteobacteria bacterium]|nr:hypothetical protein [Pseudomonadota bacterium]